jgi:hypothetical protein
VDVAASIYQVLNRTDPAGLEGPLKKMPHQPVLPISVLRVTGENRTHGPRQ